MKLKESYNVPEIGPFFVIRTKAKGNVLLNDTKPVNDADDYGDFKTLNNSHYDYWHKVQRAYSELNNYDYDYFARGRTTYNKKEDKYYLYIDHCLNNEKDIDFLMDKLNLPLNNTIVKEDEHYKCHRCNKSYINIVENKD